MSHVSSNAETNIGPIGACNSVQLLRFRDTVRISKNEEVQHENKAAFNLAHLTLGYSEEIHKEHSTGR